MNIDGFDTYAATYAEVLDGGLRVSGENSAFFARGRALFLKDCLAVIGLRPDRALDYGCGTGGGTLLLAEVLGARDVTGVDVSRASLLVAARAHPAFAFQHVDDAPPAGDCDLAFCNGVFHHIPPAERQQSLAWVRAALRPGGVFALWENNPWNPGARYIHHVLPFDRDAIMLSARETRRRLRSAGFDIVRTDYLFIFPRLLRALRGLEVPLSRLPLGAQYQVLARRPR